MARRAIALTARLGVLLLAALLLLLLWLSTGVAALSTLDDVCLDGAPASATGNTQTGSLWPPELECRYETPTGTVVEDRGGEVVARLVAVVVTGALALAAFLWLAVAVARSGRRSTTPRHG